MSGYVATKELKEYPVKGWLAEKDKERLEQHRRRLQMSDSAMVRRACQLMFDRIEREGYAAVLSD